MPPLLATRALSPKAKFLHSPRSQLLALGFCAIQPLLSISGHGETISSSTTSKWGCHPDQSGTGWHCVTGSRDTFNQRRTDTPEPEQQPSRNRGLTAAQQDWMPEDKLTLEQRAALAPGCCGQFKAPDRTDKEASLEPSSAPIRVSSDNTEWLQDKSVKLTGDVKLTQGYRQLVADQALLNLTDNTAEFNGDVKMREPGILIAGDRIAVNSNNNNAEIQNASFLLHESGVHGEASTLQAQNQVLNAYHSTYTQCSPDDITWQLKGSQFSIDPNTNTGTGRHVRLEIRNVPVLYTPYISFPISDERKSGLLVPSVSSSDNGGIDITLPYYFNLAPNYDATLSPRIISDRGQMFEAEFRHLSAKFESQISLAFLGNDEGGSDDELEDLIRQGKLTREQAYPHAEQDRWLLNVQQTGGRNQNWFSVIDFTDISDIDYFRDLDTASIEVNSSTHIKRSGTLGYRGAHWLAEIKAEEYTAVSNRAEEQYQQLPRLTLNGNYVLGEEWQFGLDHELVSFDHREKHRDQLITGDRARIHYSVAWNKQWVWGFFVPKLAVKSLRYQLDDEYLKAELDDRPAFTAPQASLDMGLYFERPGKRLLQSFEPRLFYFHSERENQDSLISASLRNRSIDFDTADLTFSYAQLFRDSRFSGGDRIDDDQRLSIGLTYRTLSATSGREIVSASIGQSIFFEDRGIALNQTEAAALQDASNNRRQSQFAAQLALGFGDNWQWRTDVAWDGDDGDRVSRGSSRLSYRDDQQRLFNLSYRYERKNPLVDSGDADNDGDTLDLIEQTTDQGDLSFSWPMGSSWNLVGRANYDFTHKRELETLFGVEYRDCCYSVRVIGRQWLDNDLLSVIDTLDLEEDRGIFIEFEFTGLGSTGNKINSILSEGIFGYQPRD